jgi:hypothetical protein
MSWNNSRKNGQLSMWNSKHTDYGWKDLGRILWIFTLSILKFICTTYKIQLLPDSTESISITKTNPFTFFRKIITVECENYTKHLHTLWGKCTAFFLNIQLC